MRERLLKARRSLSPAHQSQARLTCLKILQHPAYLAANHIAWYCAHRHEMDPGYALHTACLSNKHHYLPSCAPDHTLAFKPYTLQTPLIRQHYGILAPDTPQTFPIERIDLFIIPCVGATPQGHRLGYGKGYYDRSLAHIKAPKIGLLFSNQLLPHWTPQPHELQLDDLIIQAVDDHLL